VLSEYRGADGDLIQRQRTVFVERKPPGAPAQNAAADHGAESGEPAS